MEWYLIKVEKYEDIGKNEEETISIREIELDKDFDTETWGGCAYKVNGVHIHPATTDKSTVKHEDETANSAPIGVKTMPYKWEIPHVINKSDLIDIKKRFNNVHSRIQQLEERVSTKDDLNNAKLKAENTNRQFAERISTIYTRLDKLESGNSKYEEKIDAMIESSADWEKEGNIALGRHSNRIKSIEQQLSELQQAFVKYAICAKPDPQYIASELIEPGQLLCRNADGTVKPAGVNGIPDGIACHPPGSIEQANYPKEQDIVEQIKTGEKRLKELIKVTFDIHVIEEFTTLQEHTMKLVSLYTGLPISEIGVRENIVVYGSKKKGLRIEFK